MLIGGRKEGGRNYVRGKERKKRGTDLVKHERRGEGTGEASCIFVL